MHLKEEWREIERELKSVCVNGQRPYIYMNEPINEKQCRVFLSPAIPLRLVRSQYACERGVEEVGGAVG